MFPLIHGFKVFLVEFSIFIGGGKQHPRTLSLVEGYLSKKGFDYAQPTVAMMVSTRLSQQSHNDGVDYAQPTVKQ